MVDVVLKVVVVIVETLVVVDVFGQEVVRLPVKSEKTVWDCRGVRNGIYFYKVEIEGEVVSGKIVIQN